MLPGPEPCCQRMSHNICMPLAQLGPSGCLGWPVCMRDAGTAAAASYVPACPMQAGQLRQQRQPGCASPSQTSRAKC